MPKNGNVNEKSVNLFLMMIAHTYGKIYCIGRRGKGSKVGKSISTSWVSFLHVERSLNSYCMMILVCCERGFIWGGVAASEVEMLTYSVWLACQRFERQ